MHTIYHSEPPPRTPGQIYVLKKNGDQEPFSEEKVLRSMARVGVPEEMRPEVLNHIKEKLHQDIQTSEIFSHILEFLERKDKKASVKFNLKRAIFDLGPTGFPFEEYMSRVFERQGYKTQVDIQMRGECVNHEIDILLEKEGKRAIVESKFHNQQGTKTDIQVALYCYARFLDVAKQNAIDELWIVTNTKLSVDAAAYVECKEINAIAWNYPHESNLQDMVEDPHMYPITILDPLTHDEKRALMEGDIVLCSDFLNMSNNELLGKYSIDKKRLLDAREMAGLVCKVQD